MGSGKLSDNAIMARLPKAAIRRADSVHQNNARYIIGTLLKSCRQEAGLTQQEVARRLGVPQSVVSKSESGDRRVDLAELVNVCGALGISVTVFVDRFLDLVSKPH